MPILIVALGMISLFGLVWITESTGKCRRLTVEEQMNLPIDFANGAGTTCDLEKALGPLDSGR
jgi:hypothetical protein